MDNGVQRYENRELLLPEPFHIRPIVWVFGQNLLSMETQHCFEAVRCREF
jgi:hypothetical protein